MEPKRHEPFRVVGAQAAVTLLAAALAAAWGAEAAKAVFAGGMVAVLPNAYFAWAGTRGFRRRIAGTVPDADERQAAMAEAGRLLGRWGVKLALTVALLAFAIVVADVGSIAFFVGLGLALAAQFSAPLVAPRT